MHAPDELEALQERIASLLAAGDASGILSLVEASGQGMHAPRLPAESRATFDVHGRGGEAALSAGRGCAQPPRLRDAARRAARRRMGDTGGG